MWSSPHSAPLGRASAYWNSCIHSNDNGLLYIQLYLKVLNSFSLNVHGKEQYYLSLMHFVYTNASNNTLLTLVLICTLYEESIPPWLYADTYFHRVTMCDIVLTTLMQYIMCMYVISIFRSITMVYGTDNIMWNISTFIRNLKNIPHNIVSPTKQLLWVYIMLWLFPGVDSLLKSGMGWNTCSCC